MAVKHIKGQSGFTIVELLIVIVIIGILAVLVILSYNGIQNRAKNQQTLAAVRDYAQALKSYEVDNGSYPNVLSCLGTGYLATRCSDVGAIVSEDGGGLNSVLLKPYLSKIPSPNTTRTDYRDAFISGAIYAFSGSTYVDSSPGIGFVQFGTTTCPAVGGLTLRLTSVSDSGKDVYCRTSLD